MKRSNLIAMILCLMSAFAGQQVHADWVKVGTLDQHIPFQNMKQCKYRLTWPVSANWPPDGTEYLSINQMGFAEFRDPTTGVPTPNYQTIAFALPEYLTAFVWSTNNQGQTPTQAIDALISQDPTTRIVGTLVGVLTSAPYTTALYVYIRNHNTPGSYQLMSFQLTNPVQYTLERECVTNSTVIAPKALPALLPRAE